MSSWFGDDDDVDYDQSDVEDDKAKFKARRSSLFKTAGGSMGQELQPGQVGQRETFFGN